MNFGRRNKVHVEPAMSALSDIIFMLLIFFIIASTLAVNGEQVNLPKTNGTPTQSTLTVTITKDLRYLINSNEVSKEEVEMKLQAILSSTPDKKVVLNIDRDVPTGETIELFAVLKQNGWQPFIATKPKDQ
jgi:biopolymer transport protein ExbD